MMNNTYLIELELKLKLKLLCAFNFSMIKDPSFPFHNLIDVSSDPLTIIFRLLL